MEEENAGLPMTAKWDPEKLRQEKELLIDLEKEIPALSGSGGISN